MKGGLPKMDPSKVESTQLNGVYCEIAHLLGVEAARKIHEAFRGQQVTFPVHLYAKEFIEELIVSEYDGSNVKQLATKFGYSEKWIRKIIKDKKGE